MPRALRLALPFLLLLAAGLFLLGLWRQGVEDTRPEPRWFKGNTHTHSLWSDGNDFPEMIVAWYRDRGYHFLALSDHNVLSQGERWMSEKDVQNRRKSLGTPTLEKYRARFGNEWVQTREKDGMTEVRLRGLDEFRGLFEKPGEFLLIQAEEISDQFEDKPVHLNALNLTEVIPPQRGASVTETIRNNLRAAAAQEERTGRPVLVHLNHPNFGWGVSAEDLAHALEERYFEVYNGHPSINHLGDAQRPGDERIWDIANALRLAQLNAPPLFGVATDDSHHYHGGDVSPGRGWIMVRARTLDSDVLIRAMRAGRFYASSGVTLRRARFKDQVLRLEIEPQEGITFTTQFIGSTGLAPEEIGVILDTVEGEKPAYRLTGSELYVRATVTASAPHPNPSYSGQLQQAWTQPVGWKRRISP